MSMQQQPTALRNYYKTYLYRKVSPDAALSQESSISRKDRETLLAQRYIDTFDQLTAEGVKCSREIFSREEILGEISLNIQQQYFGSFFYHRLTQNISAFTLLHPSLKTITFTLEGIDVDVAGYYHLEENDGVYFKIRYIPVGDKNSAMSVVPDRLGMAYHYNLTTEFSQRYAFELHKFLNDLLDYCSDQNEFLTKDAEAYAREKIEEIKHLDL